MHPNKSFTDVICKYCLQKEKKIVKAKYNSYKIKCQWNNHNDSNKKCYKWSKNNSIFCKEHNNQYKNDYCSMRCYCGCLCMNKKYYTYQYCFNCYYYLYNKIPCHIKSSILDINKLTDHLNNITFSKKNKYNLLYVIVLLNKLNDDVIMNIFMFLSIRDIYNLYNLNIYKLNEIIINKLLNPVLCNRIMNFPFKVNYKLSTRVYYQECLRKFSKDTNDTLIGNFKNIIYDPEYIYESDCVNFKYLLS